MPILLVNMGLDSLDPRFEKRSALSVKNSLFSGKNNSNLVRLVLCSSTSTCEKSGLKVKSKFSEELSAILISKPASKLKSFSGKLTLFLIPEPDM